jgi:hypothetical protein
MKTINLLLFILSFVLVLGAGIAFSSPLNDKECAVYYNYRSHTKIAYVYKGVPHVITGNEDMVDIQNGKVIPLIGFYVKKEDYEENISKPSLVVMDAVWKRIYPTIALEEKEEKKTNEIKKEDPEKNTNQEMEKEGPRQKDINGNQSSNVSRIQIVKGGKK